MRMSSIMVYFPSSHAFINIMDCGWEAIYGSNKQIREWETQTDIHK